MHAPLFRFVTTGLALGLAASAAPVPSLRTWTSSAQIRSICAWDGAVWAATSGGLLRADATGKELRKLTPAEGLPEADVLGVQPWQGRLLVTFRRGIAAWGGRAWERLPAVPGADASHPGAPVVLPDRLLARGGTSIYVLRRTEDGSLSTWESTPAPEAARLLAHASNRVWLVGKESIWNSADERRWQRVGAAPAEQPVDVVPFGPQVVLLTRSAVYRCSSGPARAGVERLVDVAAFPGATHLAGVAGGDRLLVAAHGSGMWSLDPRSSAHRPYPGDPLPAVRCVTVLDGTLWAGTSSGLVRRDGASWAALHPAEELPGSVCVALALHQGETWAAFQDGTLARLRRGNWEVDPGPARGHVLQLASGGGRLWSRHSDGTLSYREGGEWRGFQPGPHDRLKWTSGVWPDPAGHSAWMGTWAGATRWQPTAEGPLRRDFYDGSPLAGEPVTAVVEHRGDLWLGTARRGIAVRRADGTWHAWHEGNGLPDGWITALASDGERLWAGTFNGGLAVWDGTRWTRPEGVPGPTGRKVTALAVDENGGVWAATRGGVGRWHAGRWRTWTQAEGLAGDEAQCLATEGREVWIGTRTGITRIVVGAD